MNDEELTAVTAVIAERLRHTLTSKPDEIPEAYAADLVGVIWDAGFRVFREDDADVAWVGMSSVDEVQDLVLDRHSEVIDVRNMDPVWVIDRDPADSGGSG